jgi:hypothetical protein
VRVRECSGKYTRPKGYPWLSTWKTKAGDRESTKILLQDLNKPGTVNSIHAIAGLLYNLNIEKIPLP